MGVTSISPARAKRQARKAKRSSTVDRLARLGLVCRGVVWVTIGILALRIAFGDGADADRSGAMQAIANQPAGRVLLVVVVVGFAGYAAWRFLEAAVGYADDDGLVRSAKRLGSAGRAAAYAYFAVMAARTVADGSAERGQEEALTARLMEQPGGRLLVGGLGAAILVSGVVIAVRGVRSGFMKKLHRLSGRTRRLTSLVGTVGLLGRGAVYALIGAFVLAAAVRYDAQESKGLDQTLETLSGQPFGRALLTLAAVGLMAYGAWSLLEARYRKI